MGTAKKMVKKPANKAQQNAELSQTLIDRNTEQEEDPCGDCLRCPPLWIFVFLIIFAIIGGATAAMYATNKVKSAYAHVVTEPRESAVDLRRELESLRAHVQREEAYFGRMWRVNDSAIRMQKKRIVTLEEEHGRHVAAFSTVTTNAATKQSMWVWGVKDGSWTLMKE